MSSQRIDTNTFSPRMEMVDSEMSNQSEYQSITFSDEEKERKSHVYNNGVVANSDDDNANVDEETRILGNSLVNPSLFGNRPFSGYGNGTSLSGSASNRSSSGVSPISISGSNSSPSSSFSPNSESESGFGPDSLLLNIREDLFDDLQGSYLPIPDIFRTIYKVILNIRHSNRIGNHRSRNRNRNNNTGNNNNNNNNRIDSFQDDEEHRIGFFDSRYLVMNNDNSMARGILQQDLEQGITRSISEEYINEEMTNVFESLNIIIQTRPSIYNYLNYESRPNENLSITEALIIALFVFPCGMYLFGRNAMICVFVWCELYNILYMAYGLHCPLLVSYRLPLPIIILLVSLIFGVFF